jgi:hypothetical protein
VRRSSRARIASVGLSLILLAAGAAAAQTVQLTGYGVAATNSEVERVRQVRGLGVGADLRMDFGRFRVEARGISASLQADYSLQQDYVLRQLQAVATFRWRPLLAFQAGVDRRFASPDLAAQEIGLIRVGMLSETRLSSLARVQAHLAWLPLARFSGGGRSSFGAELGLGVGVGRATGRLEGVVEYTYQRIDRKVNGEGVPITFSVARVGVRTRI